MASIVLAGGGTAGHIEPALAVARVWQSANPKDEISFLGISFTKGTYNALVWSIIGILAIALFVVIARSTKSILEAKLRTQLYDEISAEYQAYKTKSNEQQRKLARELQDERNAMEELRTRGK